MLKLKKKNHQLPIQAFVLTFVLLAFVQIFVDLPMIILERFIHYGGWLEIVLLAFYAAFLAKKMQNEEKVARWRSISWITFTVVFFGQLALGLSGFEKFLMTGDMHIPVPAVIIAGPIYRLNISFMPILFLSTILLSGPAWCSHLCYFGAIDNALASGPKKKTREIKQKFRLKMFFLILVIVSAITLRILDVPLEIVAISALSFGFVGLLVMIFLSKARKKMVHCVVYCPIGTAIIYLKKLSPFRMFIDRSCNKCMKCRQFCNYDALSRANISKRQIGSSCTLCGDCLKACSEDALKYSFPGLNHKNARRLYLLITISLHAVFMGLARI